MGPRSTAPNVVSPFSRCLGLFRLGPAQGPQPDHTARPMGVCHGPCSLAGCSPPSRTWRRIGGARFQKRSLPRVLQQALPWGGSRKGGTAQSEVGSFARSPEMSRRARGSAHEIRSFPLVSQRPIIVSIRLRRLYPFRIIQDREAALQQAPPAHSMKVMGVALGRTRVD